jgi:glutathione S-transferase
LNDVIFHHYPQSPVSEKVRVVFGIKDLRWYSVEVPRVPPKPDLMPLTGGYRRTPVMQIGADIYCDSQCIIRELERRFPEPTLYPDGADGLAWGLSRWTDGPLFDNAVGAVLGAAHADLPADFANDRARLYFGPRHDLASLGADLPHLLAQLRGQFAWADQHLAAGRSFMLGDDPGLPDAQLYYLVWFLRGRFSGGPALLDPFTHLCAWEKRVAALGQGESTTLSSAEALLIASDALPATARHDDPGDPQGLKLGMKAAITPDVDGGDPPVEGEILSVDMHTIALLRREPAVGSVAVHFPRVGYRVKVIT